MFRITIEDGSRVECIYAPVVGAVATAYKMMKRRIEFEGGVVEIKLTGDKVTDATAIRMDADAAELYLLAWGAKDPEPPPKKERYRPEPEPEKPDDRPVFLVQAINEEGSAPWSDIKMEEICDWFGMTLTKTLDARDGLYWCKLPYHYQWGWENYELKHFETDNLAKSHIGFWRVIIVKLQVG
jgi:hypothetical protein